MTPAPRRRLDLSNQGLTELSLPPEQLGEVTILDLRGNPLGHVPDALRGLTNLQHLSLSQKLAYLDLRANQFTGLPDSLANMTGLHKLDLRWNKLTAIPEWLDFLEARGCRVLL